MATVLRFDGWWVEHSVRVPLSKKEAVAAGKPSMAVVELDLVAYKGGENEIMIVECKSFLDSPGVGAGSFENPGLSAAKLFKLFSDVAFFKAVRRALCRRMVEDGRCGARPKVSLCLAAGHIANADHRWRLKKVFDRRKNWRLLDDHTIAEKIEMLAGKGYMNNESVVAAKILYRYLASVSS